MQIGSRESHDNQFYTNNEVFLIRQNNNKCILIELLPLISSYKPTNNCKLKKKYMYIVVCSILGH
jgi:hypothetical protein